MMQEKKPHILQFYFSCTGTWNGSSHVTTLKSATALTLRIAETKVGKGLGSYNFPELLNQSWNGLVLHPL